jgi:hypothetical protein
MKRTGLISIEHNPGDPPIKSDTDSAAVEALTAEQIEAVVRDDPDTAPILFFEQPGFIRIPNVKKLRERLGMTQASASARPDIMSPATGRGACPSATTAPTSSTSARPWPPESSAPE